MAERTAAMTDYELPLILFMSLQNLPTESGYYFFFGIKRFSLIRNYTPPQLDDDYLLHECIISAFKKTLRPKLRSCWRGDELNADISSSFRGNPARKCGEDAIYYRGL